jgi:molybdopterin/thiamine biosynthesis adenylyltransferase
VIRARARALVVGVGGIGGPAAMMLARAGVGTIGLCDDDVVDVTNLHRQIIFSEGDAAARRSKVDAARDALHAAAPSVDVRLHRSRLLPEVAVEMVREYDVVLEGADNFATKFLAADACVLAGVPVVHASAVRWVATALAVGARGLPCYRCLFEDVPADAGEGCSEAGVMGPVPGLIAAVQVDLALAMIDAAGTERVEGELVTFDGRTDALRRRTVRARADCPLCGTSRRIRRITPQAYAPA